MNVLQIDLTDKRMKDFINLPWTMKQPGLTWAPSLGLKDSVHRELSQDNPFFIHAEASAFIVFNGSNMTARLLVSIDHNLDRSKGKKIGHFGYFECIDDVNTAFELFDKAQQWFMERGVTEIHGPVNLSIFNHYRLQVKGFEYSPFPGEPRNPPYYSRLLDACGFRKGAGWGSWDMSYEELAVYFGYIERKINELETSIIEAVCVEGFDITNPSQELADLYPFIMKTFKSHFDFAKLNENEFHYFFPPERLFSPGIYGKALNEKQEIIGAIFLYDDKDDALYCEDGDVDKSKSVKKNYKNRSLIYSIAILDEYRKSKVAYQLMDYIKEHLKGIRRPLIGCLAKEGRTFYDKIGSPTREYSVYLKSL